MGLFDLASPVLLWFDDIMRAGLPPLAALIVWGVIGAIVSMALYAVLSPQTRIAEIKQSAAHARQALADYDGEFSGLWPLIGRSLGLSLKQLLIMLGPALISSLPLIFLLVWLSNTYSYVLPAPGTAVQVHLEPAAAEPVWQPRVTERDGEGAWSLPWPKSAEPITLADADGTQIASFPIAAPVNVLHKRQWWNVLLGNPAGYLPDASAIEAIAIEMPHLHVLSFGPSWLRSWEVPFFATLIIASLIIKFAFRIH